MSRARAHTRDALHRPLKVVASGTLFYTHSLGVNTHPEPGGASRAHSVAHTRGGGASCALSLLAQFIGVEALLMAPLGGNEEGQVVLEQLRKEGVSTQLCKIWENAGVPSAWVIQAG
jgi:sugar/nucleoside kinase (ribokinase family)